MAVAGEHLHRRWVAERLAWERERLEEAAREERKRIEAAERRERERLAAIAQAKIDGLLRDAGAWRDAANIRAYVDAARQSADGNMTVFDDWAQWALATVAATLDAYQKSAGDLSNSPDASHSPCSSCRMGAIGS